MAPVACFAGLDRDNTELFAGVLKAADVAPAVIRGLNVAELGRLKPDILVCDVDGIKVDRLELLRQVRFVVPHCIIVVYTAMTQRAWSVECHLAGVNGLLSKSSTGAQLATGVRGAVLTGCFTDPRFSAG